MAFRYEVVVTTHSGHARQLVSSASDAALARWRGIAVVSGDGLVHEVYNALRERQERWLRQDRVDREGQGQIANAPLLTPVGLLPGGSGCALNCSILRRVEGTKRPSYILASPIFIWSAPSTGTWASPWTA